MKRKQARTNLKGWQAVARKRRRRAKAAPAMLLTSPDGLTMEVRRPARPARRRKTPPAAPELVRDAGPDLTPAQAHRLLRRNRQKRQRAKPV